MKIVSLVRTPLWLHLVAVAVRWPAMAVVKHETADACLKQMAVAWDVGHQSMALA
ncbi:hypothetical protein M758_N018500 [Ceratodon purpureus]|nr:hypothetical protein M758_N018500 [Ceratodon purpureus]